MSKRKLVYYPLMRFNELVYCLQKDRTLFSHRGQQFICLKHSVVAVDPVAVDEAISDGLIRLRGAVYEPTELLFLP